MGRRGEKAWGQARQGLQWLIWCLVLAGIGIGVVRALPESYVLRFADTPTMQSSVASRQFVLPAAPAAEPESPMASATDWLERNGWKQVWPKWPLGGRQELFFAGPLAQRYLRIHAEKAYYIWTRQIEVDVQRLPMLAVTWSIDYFPRGAALDLYKRDDRPLTIIISFGPKVHSAGLIPNVPRSLAFFWGETETIGAQYTCITPRNGPEHARMLCQYPHVKYIALRRGEAGNVQTDRVNLVEHFQRHFPDYWQEQQRVPPVTAVSFEARSDLTGSVSSARLYTVAFSAVAGAVGQGAGHTGERQ